MKSLLFVGPVLTASGYGTHARQLLRALHDCGQYDIYVESIRWGETSYLHGERYDWIQQLCLKREKAGDRRYDIAVECTIPNEFKRRARLTVGITAGIEVDRVSPTWLVKTNEEVDVLFVPSYHSAHGFTNTRYRSPNGDVLALQRPIAVIPETFGPEFYPDMNSGNAEALDGLELADHNFLVVGLGLDKPLGEDRKNISNTILWFLRNFKDRRDVSLILKASVVNNSLMDFEVVKRRISELRELAGAPEYPKLHLVHGRLSDGQLADLYRDPRITALVSLTHGEGFGLPMLEAAACGLPVIATDWSGHTDFLTIDGIKHFSPVEHKLATIPQSAVWPGVMEAGSQWADPIEESFVSAVRAIIEDDGGFHRNTAAALAEHVNRNYSPSRLMQELVADIESAWQQSTSANPETKEEMVDVIRRQLLLKPTDKTILFTMPMSGGDVYLSTAVVRKLKERHPDHYIFFATQEKYADILEGNPDIYQVIGWQPWMQDVGLLEDIFSEVYTPNLAIQMTYSNWVHKGRGRNLFHEIAVQCGVDPDEMGGPVIKAEEVQGLPTHYVVIHTGAGKGQWGARKYNHWQDVVGTVGPILRERGIEIVQVGLADEPQLQGTVDLRAKTNYRQLAYVVSQAMAVVSIDSIVMHMAAHHGVPHVALFGGSYATTTGTAYGGAEAIPRAPFMTEAIFRRLIETEDRLGCDRACYKNECRVDPESPCINNIDPSVVCELAVLAAGGSEEQGRRAFMAYKPRRPRISGYTHVYNAKTHDYPFVESIRSMLGFCEEVVVVDGGSTDGTVEEIQAIGDPRVKVIHNQWDHEEPGMDGMQKAFARIMCDPSAEFLWQQDCDEVVHEDDYEKVFEVARRFPADVPLVHLPVVELWGDEQTVRTDRHAWKWRLSRNEFNVTHGIVKHARVLDQKTGRVYSKPGMSDGCEYIDVMTGEYIKHRGFWDGKLDWARENNVHQYADLMHQILEKLPAVYHYSWVDIPRKVRNFKKFWNQQWSRLYNDPASVDRFPDVETEEDILRKAEELKTRGGEHGSALTFRLKRTNPAVMKDWLERRGK